MIIHSPRSTCDTRPKLAVQPRCEMSRASDSVGQQNHARRGLVTTNQWTLSRPCCLSRIGGAPSRWTWRRYRRRTGAPAISSTGEATRSATGTRALAAASFAFSSYRMRSVC
ncbi:hypothetical protein SGR_195 [Streptomyces griseus subsp. griseus NBRC 13350]|uniref:Uncharacterized protein n=1 Tax=Streptomyces griseus subsp. griseus (strain JCM 4626 / CBS 651.72 / NBRC 13350 / KCC S-0626 / ISP 5235) TaxID=455632 RepID=B1VNK1_STRGG|nr:hypothetical protein SGR_195 [Streptomyces griseus subsp. griseus NBRC 13350]